MKNKLEEMTKERDDYKEQSMQQQISLKDLREKLNTFYQLDLEKTVDIERLSKLYKKKCCLYNLKSAIEYINIVKDEIKNNKNIEEEYSQNKVEYKGVKVNTI